MRETAPLQKWKRAISFIVTFAMLLGMVSMGVFAQGVPVSTAARVQGEAVYYISTDTDLVAGNTYQAYPAGSAKSTPITVAMVTGSTAGGFYTASQGDSGLQLVSQRSATYQVGEDCYLMDALVYAVDEDTQVMGFNVVYSASVKDTPIVDQSGNNIKTLSQLAALVEAKAVTADLFVNASGQVVSLFITDIRARPTVGISWKSDKIGKDYLGFAEAFERNGAIAVFLPQITDAASAREALSKVDGIFVTGGEDINPARYNEQQTPHGSGRWNDARDTSDIHLIQQAIALDIPLLGVCRGEQIFNVAMGGGLIQDVPLYLGQQVTSGAISEDRVTNTYQDKGYSKWNEETQSFEKFICEEPHLRVNIDGLVHSGGTSYHELAANSINKDSKWLYDIIGSDSVDVVATAHHQSLNPDKLGNGLTIVAHSSDGIVEGIEYQDNLFALGIQWHPERDALSDSRGVDVDQDLCNAVLRTLVQYASIYAKDSSGGGSSGGGSGSGGSSSGSSTVKNPDGSTATSVVDKTTGMVTTTVSYPNGVKIVAKATTDGKVTANVTVPTGKDSVTVTIPAQNATATTVAMLLKPDGTQEVIKSSVLNQAGIAVTLTQSAELVLVDNAKSFSDVSKDQWYCNAVNFVTSRELFSGMGNGEFAPGSAMTRSMLWTVLYSLDGGKATGPVWYADAQNWAQQNGISDGTNPDGEITREQMAVILYGYAKDSGYKVTASGSLSNFKDADQIADWANEAMKWAVGASLLSGKDSGNLDPSAGATRAELAQILMNFQQNLAG